MNIETFQDLPVGEVARIMQEKGPKVCGFPINGTRRWYMLETDSNSDYLTQTAQRHVEIYEMLFAHGIDTILAPMFGTELLRRGIDYLKLAVSGLNWLATNPIFLQFYEHNNIRVHFYGNYRKLLASTPYAGLLDTFDELTRRTRNNTRARLFFGVFADNATEATAEMTIQYYREHGRAPDRRQLEEMFYGEPVGPVDLFIGFDKFSMFDMPLVSTESTDLYFTVNPSLYLSQHQLRSILFDYLYTRCAPEPDYEDLSKEAIEEMRQFYKSNGESAFGVGVLRDGIWYPCLLGESSEPD